MSFPFLLGQGRRQTIRQAVNPLDKATIVSIFPRDIREVKHTLQPSTYEIPAGTYEKPSILTVGTASWWREIDPEQPLIEIPTSSILVANSIVDDYCNGLLMCNMGDVKPGLFFIPGEHNLVSIRKDYQKLLDNARENQKRWYLALVKLGDTLWARHQGNPLGVPDLSRLAAIELGLQDKEWTRDSALVAMVKCVACGNLRNPDFPICPHCKAIVDPEKAKSLNLAFAKG